MVIEYSEERLQELNDFFENALMCLHIVDSDGVIQWANTAELESLGYAETPEEYLGHHIAEFHADQDVIEDILQRLTHGKPLLNYEARLIRKDGSIQPVLIYSNSRMEDGKFINTRCFTRPNLDCQLPQISKSESLANPSATNINHWSEAEKRRKFYQLNDFFENAQMCLHIVDSNGVIKRANTAELEFLGYAETPEDYIGHHIAEFHADQDVIEDMLQRLVNDKPLLDYEAQLVCKDGSVQPVRIYSNSRIEEGKFINTRCFTYSHAAQTT